MQRSRRFLAIAAIAASLCCPSIVMAMPDPALRNGAVLGSAASFAVLGESAVTSSGATRVTGNLGVSPGTAVSGFPPGTVRIGAIYRDEAIARQAHRDLAAAYDDLSGRRCTGVLTGSRLAPGVYCADAFVLHGTLILDAGGDPDAVWIFRGTTSLLADPESKVLVTGGGSEGNVYWHVGTTAGIGANATFAGTILARNGITIESGATITGRTLTQNGVVTLDSSSVNACCKTLTVSPLALPGGMECSSYSATLTASGGMASYTFALTSGTLPAGLTLSPAGIISGKPAAGGSSTFTVTATDANGCPGTAAYTIEIVPCGSTAIVLSPPTLPSGTVGSDYVAAMTASGGTAPYAFSVTCGALPPGIAMTPAGVLSGVPTTVGIFTFTITATDATGAKGCRTYTITIDLPIPPVIMIEPASLAGGVVGTFYSETLTASGGTAPYTFIVPPASLPPGLTRTFTGTSIEISGTPTKDGTFPIPIRATDANGFFVETVRTIDVVDVPVLPCLITVTPLSLPDAIVGTAYSEALTAAGCTPPHTFEQAGGTIPAGLTLSSAGVVSGIPTVAGPFAFTVKATDAIGRSTPPLPTITIVVACPTITLTPATLPRGKVGTFYDKTITAGGGTAPYTFVVSGDLPDGLTATYSNTTVKISGFPTAVDTHHFTITAIDHYGCQVTRPYSIQIRSAVFSPLDIPTLSEWLLALFTLLMAGAGIACIRKWGG
jgi:large repetitive protein